MTLAALTETDARQLVDSLSAGELGPLETARIVRAAEGNPLFLEQLVASDEERGESAILPPSIQAVLAARIAGLDPAERTVLERASVEGRNFSWSSVAALLSDQERAGLGEHLMALVRRQLIQPNPTASSVEDAFRFTHVLIQEVAYDGVPKEVRADLHERLARRLDARPEGEDEVVGFHLEQSYRCRAELGLVGSHERELAPRGDRPARGRRAQGLRARRTRQPAATCSSERRRCCLQGRSDTPRRYCPRSGRRSSRPVSWPTPTVS